jgi:hypothetical protein
MRPVKDGTNVPKSYANARTTTLRDLSAKIDEKRLDVLPGDI